MTKQKNLVSDIQDQYVQMKKSRKNFLLRNDGIGVSENKSKIHPWKAMVGFNRCNICLGVFATKEEAAEARDLALIKLNGPRPNRFKLRLNYPEKFYSYLDILRAQNKRSQK